MSSRLWRRWTSGTAACESGPVTFTPEYGLGVKWRNPADDDDMEGLKDSWATANKEVASKREKDEENRLLYVAMTRAAEHLILSYSHGKNRPLDLGAAGG